jgi:hypothetical protein
MNQKIVTPGTSAVSLTSLLDISQSVNNSVIIQAHKDNTGLLYFGDNASQAHSLEAKDAIRLYVPYKDIYLKGDGSGDKAIVTLE